MLIKNIGILAGIVPEGVLRKEGASQGIVDCLENAWLLIEDGRISAFGPMSTCPSVIPSEVEESHPISRYCRHDR